MTEASVASTLTNITLTVDGVNLGTFTKKSGESSEVEVTQVWPGGGAQRVSVYGQKTVSDVTLARPYDDFIADRRKWLVSKQGKASCVVSTQRLDAERFPVGAPDVVTGLLSTINFPDAEAGSSDAREIEIEISGVDIL